MNIAVFFHEIKQRSIAIWYEDEKLKAFLPKGTGLTADEKTFVNSRRADILAALKTNKVFSPADFGARKIFRDLNDGDSLGLSFAQERLWFIEQFEGGSTAYHIPMAFDLGADADRDAFKKSIQSVVARHEVLRTVFRTDDEGNDYQLVLDDPPPIAEKRITEKDLPERLQDGINAFFDLVGQGPLKVDLFDTDKSLYCLIVVHHIAFDGWSGEVFLNELETFYRHYRNKAVLALSEPDIQYKDFALWQKTRLHGDVLQDQLDYWKNSLQEYETLAFPTDKPRPSRVDYRGDDLGFELDKMLSAKLRKLATDQGVTLFSLFLSAFYVLLNKYCGQNSLVVGTPVANRQYDQLENLIGFFVNSLALNFELEGALPFEKLIQGVQNKTMEAQQYQDLPFEKLVEALGVGKDLSRHPVFQVMFGVESFAINEQRLFKPLALDRYYNPASLI